jgi:hypothetical protein
MPVRHIYYYDQSSVTANDIEKSRSVVSLYMELYWQSSPFCNLLPPSLPGVTIFVSCLLAVAHVLRTYTGLHADRHMYVLSSSTILHTLLILILPAGVRIVCFVLADSEAVSDG